MSIPGSRKARSSGGASLGGFPDPEPAATRADHTLPAPESNTRSAMHPQAMHPELNLTAAQQHIADVHGATDHNLLVHTATAATATSSHAIPRTPPSRRSGFCAASALCLD